MKTFSLVLIFFSQTIFAGITPREQWQNATGFRLPAVSSDCVLQIYYVPKNFYDTMREFKFSVVDEKGKIYDLRPWLEQMGLSLVKSNFAFGQKESGLCIIGTTKQNHDLIRSLNHY